MTDKSPPAFPCTETIEVDIDVDGDEYTINKNIDNQGMSLRDYFAGQALAGFRAHPANPDTPKTVAMFCYEIADAMLAEREKS